MVACVLLFNINVQVYEICLIYFITNLAMIFFDLSLFLQIHMKTMPTSIFRLLTGQETPHYL